MDRVPPPSIADALYDFLYLDRERIGSYTAQFDDFGVLTQTKRTASASETGGKSGSAGIPQLASGAVQHAKTSTDTIDRQYDPRYTVPLTLIEHLENAGMIQRELSSASLGTLVLVRGSLEITDIRMMKSLWKPIMAFWMRSTFSAHIDQKITEKGKKGAELLRARAAITAQEEFKVLRSRMTEQFSTLADIVQVLPHPLQASIKGEHGATWSVLDPQHMTTNVDGFALMHGKSIPGMWSAIALVDALPENDEEHSDPFKDIGERSKTVESMNAMQEMLRNQFGRPRTSYGISPIAIYRSIEPNPSER